MHDGNRRRILSVKARRAALTRRLYAWESEFVIPVRQQSMRALRAWARKVWEDMAHPRYGCPVIVAGNGHRQNGRWMSYCEGRSRIVLARQDRNRRILAHELAHALGPETHGIRFQERYAEILGKWL